MMFNEYMHHPATLPATLTDRGEDFAVISIRTDISTDPALNTGDSIVIELDGWTLHTDWDLCDFGDWVGEWSYPRGLGHQVAA